MANHASALKRARQSITRRKRNVANKTVIKNIVKEVRTVVAEKKAVADVQDVFRKAVSVIHKNGRKGVIHRKKADRKISRLARLINKSAAA